MTTKLFILGAILLIAAYDIFALIHGGSHSTISWVLFANSKAYPAIPFVFGFLFGHVFWVQKQ